MKSATVYFQGKQCTQLQRTLFVLLAVEHHRHALDCSKNWSTTKTAMMKYILRVSRLSFKALQAWACEFWPNLSFNAWIVHHLTKNTIFRLGRHKGRSLSVTMETNEFDRLQMSQCHDWCSDIILRHCLSRVNKSNTAHSSCLNLIYQISRKKLKRFKACGLLPIH